MLRLWNGSETPLLALVQQPQVLQDVMLAMDVVDTLRHADTLVDRELHRDAGEPQLLARLRQIYADQGIEVSERILREGVQALADQRFTYEPAGSQWQRRLARLYIGRQRWAKMLFIPPVLLWGLYMYSLVPGALPVQHSDKMLPIELRKAYVNAIALADGQHYMNGIEAINYRGQQAVQQGDRREVQAAINELEALNDKVNASYQLRVINEPGAASTISRVEGKTEDQRGYYLVVEPINKRGWPVAVAVRDGYDGKERRVKRFALKVSKTAHDSVVADLQDDGRLQHAVVATKHTGLMELDYAIDKPLGVITRW